MQEDRKQKKKKMGKTFKSVCKFARNVVVALLYSSGNYTAAYLLTVLNNNIALFIPIQVCVWVCNVHTVAAIVIFKMTKQCNFQLEEAVGWLLFIILFVCFLLPFLSCSRACIIILIIMVVLRNMCNIIHFYC